MRASDRDREQAIRHLRRAFERGRLSLETFEARVDRAIVVRELADLERLTGDCGERPSRLTAVRARVATLMSGPRGDARAPELHAPPPSTRPFAIGRSSRCDCIFEDKTVSRTHAQLTWSEGRWVLRDLDSLNGTWVNGWRVDEAPLHDGDRVQLGGIELTFRAV